MFHATPQRTVLGTLLLASTLTGCAQKALPVVVADEPDPVPVVIAPEPQPRDRGPDAPPGLPLGPRAVLREVAPDRVVGQTVGGTLRGVLGAEGHSVSHIAFTPDGRWVLGAGRCPAFKAWDLKTGDVAGTYSVFPPKEKNQSVKIWGAPDGRTLAASGPQDELWLWDLSTGAVRLKLKASDSFSQVAFTADGNVVFTLNGRRVHSWDTETGRELTTSADVAHGLVTHAMVATADGRTVALAGEGGNLVILNGETLREKSRVPAHAEWICALALSPDGKTLASAGFRDKRIKLWNLDTATEIRSFDCGCSHLQHFEIAFSPTGKLLAAGERSVSLLEVATGTKVGELPGGFEGINALAFSPDGTVLAAGLGGKQNGVAVWELTATLEALVAPLPPVKCGFRAISPDGTRAAIQTGADVLLRDLSTGTDVTVVRVASGRAFSPDGSLFAVERENGILAVVDSTTGKEQFAVDLKTKAEFWPVTFRPDGKRLAVAVGSEVRVWNLASAPPQELKFAGAQRGRVGGMAFSPNGKHIAVGVESALALLDAETGQPRWFVPAHEGKVGSVAFSPDGTRVLISARAENDHSARLFDAADGRVLTTFRHPTHVSGAFFTGAATVATIAGDGDIRLWDATEGMSIGSRPGPKPNGDAFVAADGKAVAVVREKMVHLYPIAALNRTRFANRASLFRQQPPAPVPPAYLPVRAVLKWHNAYHRLAAFTADGTRFVSVDTNGKVAVWNPATGARLQGFTARVGEFRDVTMSADGKRLAFCARESTTVSVWNLETEREEHRIRTGNRGMFLWAIALSPDGKLLATGGGSVAGAPAILLWDVGTGKRVGELDYGGTIRSLTLTNDGKLLVGDWSEFHQFDVAQRSNLPTDQPPDGVRIQAISADGGRVLVGPSGGTFGGMAVWNRTTGKLSQTLYADNTEIEGAAFGPDGLIAVNTHKVFLWDTDSGKLLSQFFAPGVTAISPDGKTLVVVRDWLSDKESLVLVDLRGLVDEQFQAALRPALALGAKITPDGDGLRVEMPVGGPDSLAALAALDRAAKPFTLVMGASALPDTSVKVIAGLKNLRTIALRAASSADAVHALAGFSNFTELALTNDYDVKMTSADANRLKELKNLRRFQIAGFLQGDAELALLSDLTWLKELDVSGRRIANAGLVHIKGMTELEVLDLRATKISDAGLVHLEGLLKLRRLSVGKTEVTKKGIEDLKKKLPELQVHTD